MDPYYDQPYYHYPPPPPRSRRPSPAPSYHHHHHAYLNPEANMWGNGLHRSRSHGHAPIPQVNIYQDIAQETMQRADPRLNTPSPTHSNSSSRRGRRSMLDDELYLDELALERAARSRSRGRSDAAWFELERAREGEKLEHAIELQRARDDKRRHEEQERLEYARAQDEKHRHDEDQRIEAAIQERKQREEKARKEQQQAVDEWNLKQAKAKQAKEDEEKELRAKWKREDEEKKEKEKKAYEDFMLRERLEKEEKAAKEKKLFEELKMKEKLEKEEKDAREKKAYEEFKLKEERDKKAKEEKEKAEEKKAEELMATRMRKAGYTEEQIQKTLHPEEHKKKTKVKVEKTFAFPSPSPTYPKIHKDYLSVDTLIYYNLPYEYDKSDPNYIIILREMDRHETEVLFEHTRRHRTKQLLIEQKKPEKKYAWVRHKSRSPSYGRGDVKVMEIVRR
ncbi:MAG: hypothetical protein M1821_003502 [Bathelium mastoideum]|nr:MAG: hypothetical protein M1821_003502 [Bathelium mastoideum]KAI9682590.1 MAG: hypothetical protein M1822_006888 [Bathelium mastoideum]